MTPNGFAVTRPGPGTRHVSVTTTAAPASLRDASGGIGGGSGAGTGAGVGAGLAALPSDNGIRPAKKFDKFIEYDFARMTDTKGGFLSADDDPHNRAMMHRQVAAAAEQRDAGAAGAGAGASAERPSHMSEQEWERLRLLRSLRAARAGPFEPGVSALDARDKLREGKSAEVKQCRECGSLDVDWKWEDVFNGLCVCNACRDKLPDKYSLLTKTEVKEDYLLTERMYYLSFCAQYHQYLTTVSLVCSCHGYHVFFCFFFVYINICSPTNTITPYSRAERPSHPSPSLPPEPAQTDILPHAALPALPGRRLRL